MEYLLVTYLFLSYTSGWIAFNWYRKNAASNKTYQFKGIDVIKLGLGLYIFALPVFILYRNYSIPYILVYHPAWLVFTYYVSDAFIKQTIIKYNGYLIYFVMALSAVSGILMSPFTVKDGEYCAHVEYYNSQTGTKRLYKLQVIVEENKVIRINFPNEGWLDEDHFDAQEIDKNGEVMVTDDDDREFTISHLKKGECN